MTAAGHKYILVITDMFSKWVEAFPLQTTDSRTLANVFVNQIVCHYSILKSIHSDQGANLTSEIIQHMCACHFWNGENKDHSIPCPLKWFS